MPCNILQVGYQRIHILSTHFWSIVYLPVQSNVKWIEAQLRNWSTKIVLNAQCRYTKYLCFSTTNAKQVQLVYWSFFSPLLYVFCFVYSLTFSLLLSPLLFLLQFLLVLPWIFRLFAPSCAVIAFFVQGTGDFALICYCVMQPSYSPEILHEWEAYGGLHL